jgi:hypothetical protein
MYNPGPRSTLGRLWNDLGSHACVGIFEDEILAGAKGTSKPAEDVPEPYDHAKNLTGTLPIELGAKSLILWVYDVLMNDSPKSGVQTNNNLLCMCDAQQTIKIGM